ncbi:ROK family protein [Enterococcus nangangensis]|uniref:ROK family protein n=1 Tax=Enterococcus nangangensis TaxID=2559926 RepID=UPI0010F4474A|nr:ROK family protein [Enterococcus nangangensis]
MLYGGIEAGGTKFICAVANENFKIIAKGSIATGEPQETLAAVYRFFDQYTLSSLGVASFGPIGIQPGTEDYGYILQTPKKAWQNFNLLGAIQTRYAVPTAWTTDVNAAAYGELKLGAAKGADSCLYLTIGTGIGGGLVLNGKIYSGFTHPEMGHLFLKRHPQDDYQGSCPYHHDCFEGLAAGPSLEARTGIKGQDLPEDHPVWELQAFYIAQALISYTLMVAPTKIILGGGVMNQEHLLKKIQCSFKVQLQDYVVTPPLAEYIVKWGLPNESGIYGSLLLGKEAIV